MLYDAKNYIKRVVKQLKMFKRLFGSKETEYKGMDESDDCCICYEPLKDGVTMELECHHRVHTPCGIMWLKQKQSCPLCRGVQVEREPVVKEKIKIVYKDRIRTEYKYVNKVVSKSPYATYKMAYGNQDGNRIRRNGNWDW